MGDGRLDDRHVLYDLTSAISILPIVHGGTGSNTLMQGITAGDNRVVCTDAGGNRLVADAQITVNELRALNGADQAVGTPTPSVQSIHNRIVSLENHAGTQGNLITYNKIHVPAPTTGQGGYSLKAKPDLTGYELTTIREVPAAPSTNPQNYLLAGNGNWVSYASLGLPATSGTQIDFAQFTIGNVASPNGTQTISLAVPSWATKALTIVKGRVGGGGAGEATYYLITGVNGASYITRDTNTFGIADGHGGSRTMALTSVFTVTGGSTLNIRIQAGATSFNNLSSIRGSIIYKS